MSDFTASQALDETGRHHGRYQDAIAFYLPGPDSPQFWATT